jgi:uncharacterized protein (TIGR02594 family)
MNILEIQTALKKQGFDPGDLDGEWGRRTIAALKAFQQARRLTVDGIAGPKTLAVLFGSGAGGASAAAPSTAPIAGPLVWFEEALRLVGTNEKLGPGSNETIIHWAKDCNIDYKSDDIPWCGLFVSHCIAATLPEEPLPNAPLGARSWRKFGAPSKPVQGAVLVFWRDNKNGPFGHVGFYRGEDDDAYHVLGGNQSDSVSTCRISKSRLLDARWPRTAASLTGQVVLADGNGVLSHNEA